MLDSARWVAYAYVMLLAISLVSVSNVFPLSAFHPTPLPSEVEKRQTEAGQRAKELINSSLSAASYLFTARQANTTQGDAHFAVVIPTVRRAQRRYLTRTILSVVRAQSTAPPAWAAQGKSAKQIVRVVVLDCERDEHKELRELEAAGVSVVKFDFSKIVMNRTTSTDDPTRAWLLTRHAEYQHYLAALRLCLDPRLSLAPSGLCLLLQDDVVIAPTAFHLLRHLYSSSSFRERWIYLRLHLPLHFGRWYMLDPEHATTLFKVGIISSLICCLFIGMLHVCGRNTASTSISSPPEALNSLKENTAIKKSQQRPCSLFMSSLCLAALCSFLLGPGLALILGRFHFLELFSLWMFPPHGYHVIAAKKCCIAGTVYQRQVLPDLIAYLEKQQQLSNLLQSPPSALPPLASIVPQAIDLTIHRWALEEGGKGKKLEGEPGRVEPNLAHHIGFYSSLSCLHLETPYRQEELAEHWLLPDLPAQRFFGNTRCQRR
eukprot:g31010.t1